MNTALCLIDDHLVATADEDSDCLRLGTAFDENHTIFRCSEANLPDHSGLAQFRGIELFKAWHDTSAGGNGNEFDFHTTHPPNSREIVGHQQVVRFIVKAPLAANQCATGVLADLYHLGEILLLLLVQFVILFGGGDIDLVLRLGFGWLEWTRQDRDLRILDLLCHLRMTDILVKHDAVHQARVLQPTSSLSFQLDKIEVNIFPPQICDCHDGFDTNLCNVALVCVHDLGAQGRHGSLDQGLQVVRVYRKSFGNRLQMCCCNFAGSLVTLGNSDRVNPFVQQAFGVVQ
mmetsp:Transcript_26658/g.45290  ORF Transcript_26658/g.45290 Transcript_26658/m.45290 type:complete len:288 (+) Transcript_26658:1303-2166(+)